MAHELARRSASMFDDRGAMTVANLKVDLARTQAEVGWMYSILRVMPSPSCETSQNSSTSSVATSSCVESSRISKMFDRCKEGSKRKAVVQLFKLK